MGEVQSGGGYLYIVPTNILHEQHMTEFRSVPPRARIAESMIQLARASKSHRMIMAGPSSSEVLLELHQLGYLRVKTAKLCRASCGQFEVALVIGIAQPGLSDCGAPSEPVAKASVAAADNAVL